MNILEVIRKKCDELITTDPDKYNIIKKILEDDECFTKIGIDEAYNILADLEYSEEQIKKIYMSLVKKENV